MKFQYPLLAATFLFYSLLIPAASAAVSVKVSADREEAIYSENEEVTFSVSAFDGEKKLDWGEVEWRLTLDGYREISKGKGTLEGGKGLSVSGKLDKPGFLLLTATFTGTDGKRVSGYGGAAVSPLKIGPSMPAPDDFDAFWKSQKEALAKVPLKFEESRQPVKAGAGKVVQAFDVQIDCGKSELPVSGYFAKPEKAEAGSLPAVLWVHGAGVRSSILTTAVRGAENGFLSMDINAHGIPNGKPAQFYTDLSKGELKTYRTDGNTSRDEIYFRGMCLRLVRAIDYLTSKPEWDGKTVAVIGHSQGGYQALVAGGLDERVTFIGSGVPAGCDHTGMMAGRISGWPKIVPILPDGKPNPAAVEACRYIDGMNFASRCKAEAIVSVGFIDRTCPATSVYAAYNVLQGKKQMINEPSMGHAAPAPIKDRFFEALMEHVGMAAVK